MAPTRTRTTLTVEPAPGRCARCGCHRPQAPGEPIGLCTLHHTQLLAGTIGHDHDPNSRETDVSEAQDLLEMVGEELFGTDTTPSVRRLGARLGVSKDVCHHVRCATWQHIRSISWEAIQDAVANALYELDQQQHEQHSTAA
ncbi:MAG: hypothetical protein ACTH2Y_08440 [Corynebacterium sp.]|jgi:hypothetical protein|uniref:hypothetical protein n=1 Tax=Corynebacterium sp. TaxID=1720 RepID=UPI003F8E9B0E